MRKHTPHIILAGNTLRSGWAMPCFYRAVISVGLMLPALAAFTQAKWEADFLRAVNPRYPSNDVWRTVSVTAKPLSVAVPLGMFAIGLAEDKKEWKQKAFETGGSLLIAAAGSAILKKISNRPRPAMRHTDIYPDQYNNSPSFPSGHVSVAFASAASVSLQYKKWYITVPAYAWAAGVAYSRMYLGQHYPSDVLMGAATGVGSAYLANWLHRKFFSRISHPQTKRLPNE